MSYNHVENISKCVNKVQFNETTFDDLNNNLGTKHFSIIFKTVLSSGYILILLSIEYILASLIEMCQG